MTILDLVIALSPPPADAPEEVLASYEMRCDALGRQRVSGDLTNPFDELLREDVQWYLEESWKWPYGEFLERAQQMEQRLEQMGQTFYAALFDTADAQRIVQPWNLQPLQQ
jgi:hypothetical protein